MTPKAFSWGGDGTQPPIQPHTSKKLKVIKQYLDDYFDTVVPNPRTDNINITLVDGFCGGGVYRNGDAETEGSPLLLLRAVSEAKTRLNQNRKKPLTINAKFHFNDIDRNHVESLKETIISTPFQEEFGDSIEYSNLSFVEALPTIIAKIKKKQNVGRSIFLLDQKGYKDAPMDAIKSIFALNRAEVLLTFAIDHLLNYLTEKSLALPTYADFEIDKEFLDFWQAHKKDEKIGRQVTQRLLISKLHRQGGAKFFTPFMLWSGTENRTMMLAHLSNHQAARNVMLKVHWGTQNSFKHYGSGSLFQLGFDHRNIKHEKGIFNFASQDAVVMQDQLMEELPRELNNILAEDQPVSVQHLLEFIGNRTAATNDHIFEVLKLLIGHHEIDIVGKKQQRRGSSSLILPSDEIYVPKQKSFLTLN